MAVSSASLAQAARARIALAELAMFKAGQVLQAVVVGKGSDGQTLLKIGDTLVHAQLPQELLPGTTLQLQVKTGGSAPKLVLVSQTPPATAQVHTAQSLVLPRAAHAVVLPQESAPVAVQSQVLPAISESPQTAAPVASQNAPTPAAPQPAPPAATSDVQTPPIVTSRATVQPGAKVEQAASGDGHALTAARAAPAQAVAGESSPQRGSVLPLLADAAAPPAATASPAPNAQPSAQSAQVVTPAVAAAPTGSVEQSPAPQHAPPSQPVTPVAVVPEEPIPQPAIVAQAPAGQPTPPAKRELQPSTPGLQPQHSNPQIPPTATSGTAQEPVAAQAEIANPLLVAQAAAKPVTVAASNLPLAQASPPQSPAGPPPAATTPQAALAQMIPEAMAKQNSVAPLLMSLAALVTKPTGLPEPIVRAAMQVLAQRIAVPEGRVSAEAVARAVASSGVFLEAGIAAGSPPPADMKAALLNLRAVVTRLFGEQPSAPATANRAPPPVHGLPPRAVPVEAPPLPDTPRDIARLVHHEADAAVSRVKLAQLASLPDTPMPRAGGPEVRLELPFLIGHELVMAQIQIARDGGRRDAADRKRGWTMRFAMNFSTTGEVGAEVGLLSKAVNVALWAVEPETADALTAAMPELGSALEAVGLTPGSIRVRRGPPDQAKVPSGQLLDSLS